MSEPTWTDIGTFWIAVLALWTSAVSIALSVVQFRLTGSLVKVEIAQAALIEPSVSSAEVIVVTATNIGRVPVVITSMGLLAGKSKNRHRVAQLVRSEWLESKIVAKFVLLPDPSLPNSALPTSLQPGHPERWFIRPQRLDAVQDLLLTGWAAPAGKRIARSAAKHSIRLEKAMDRPR